MEVSREPVDSSGLRATFQRNYQMDYNGKLPQAHLLELDCGNIYGTGRVTLLDNSNLLGSPGLCLSDCISSMHVLTKLETSTTEVQV